ncbi:hypothetical protein [Aquimarina macrocephali]|uniref:hypothetical protein n=1 Tax=Aquimarina macrocephali TaxID=666563 RepID=UPI003F668818
MASVAEIKSRLQKLTMPVLRKEASKLIVKSQDVINAKRAELKSGLRPDGNIIGEYKSDAYKKEKIIQNPSAGGTVDLIRTKSFSKKLFVQNSKPSHFMFESTDEKSTMLFEKYGEDVRSLNQKTFEEVWRLHLAKDYIAALKKITGL